MQVIPFNGAQYSQEVLKSMSLSELRDLYNRAGSVTRDDFREVNKFSDKESAVRRTWDVLIGGKGEVAAVPPPRASAPRRSKFQFPAGKDQITPRIGTLRYAVYVRLLLGPCTFDQLVDEVVAHDKDLGVESKNADRRAYEVVRILHYQCGFGFSHGDDGLIRITIPFGDR